MTATDCEATPGARVTLPNNPFVSNRYHYGMLLGVADLETEQGYHRGKTWLHNAWLHGGGAIWGLKVDRGSESNQLIVRRGLALDHHGRELWLSHDECIDIAQWYAKQDADDVSYTMQQDDCVEAIAYVELCADQCADRPVPSISEPCDGSDLDIAYSRTVERAKPELVAGKPEPLRDLYPRLRAQLPGPAQRDDTEASANKEDCPARLHRLAVEDTMELSPAGSGEFWSPFEGDGCITLARLVIRLDKNGADWTVSDFDIDNTVRPIHIQNRAAQELLWDALCCCAGEHPKKNQGTEGTGGKESERSAREEGDTQPYLENPEDGDTEDTDREAMEPEKARRSNTGSFQVVSESPVLEEDRLHFSFTRPVAYSSLRRSAVTVSALRSNGWRAVAVDSIALDDTGTVATLNLANKVNIRPVRVHVRGGGDQPVLSEDSKPLLGCTGDTIIASGGFDAALVIAETTEPDGRPLPPDPESISSERGHE